MDTTLTNSNLIRPVALGIISDPATIVLTYDSMSGGKRKRRKRKMPLRDFTDRSNVKRYAFNIRQRHHKYLSEVIDVTLEKMLRIIQEIQKGKSVDASVKTVHSEYSLDPEENLNLLSPAQLEQRKSMMEETFRKNLLKPGDPGYVYDKEIHFDGIVTSTSANDWDDERSDDSQDKQNNCDTVLHADDDKDNSRVEVPQPHVSSVDDTPPPNDITKENEEKDGTQSVNVEDVPKKFGISESEVAAKNSYGTTEEVPEMKTAEMRTNKQEVVNDSADESDEPLMDIEVGDIEEEDEDFWK